MTVSENEYEEDDSQENQTELNLEKDDELELHEQLNNMAVANEEDYEFHHMLN